MTTEEYKQEMFERVRKNYFPNMVKGYMKQNGIPLTNRKNTHPERDIQNTCLEWLKLEKICHVRLAVNSSQIFVGGKMVRLPNPMKGWPDTLCIINGRAIGIEFKDKTKQSESQVEVQEYIEKAGGLYYIVHSLDELIKVIKPLLI